MVQGFPSLAINCMQILFCVCACVWQCVYVSVRVCLSEAKPKREAVPLKQNWKKKNAFRRPITVEWAKDQDLQLSYINPAESGWSDQFALLSNVSVFHPFTRKIRQRKFSWVLTGRQQSQKPIADFYIIFISWRLLTAGSNLCQSL